MTSKNGFHHHQHRYHHHKFKCDDEMTSKPHGNVKFESVKLDTEMIYPEEGVAKKFKPYPVQPGFEEIKANMKKMAENMEMLARGDTGENCAGAGGSSLNQVQLAFLVTNIVQTVDEAALENLLQQSPHLLNTTFSNDHTNIIGILHLAAVRGSREILDIIMSKGATVDLRSGQQETPLHFACRRGVLATVRYLIEHGADVHAVDEQENTTAHFAAHAGSGLILELLFQLGVNLNARNASGQTVAHILCQFSNIACLQFLLKHRRIDPNVKDANGLNALDFAIRLGEANQVVFFLEYFPSLARSMKPLPDPASFENPKLKVRVDTTVKVVQAYQKPRWKKNAEYVCRSSQVLFFLAISILLKSYFGYFGALSGMFIMALDAYLTYHSSHRVQYEKTPNPLMAGAFFSGLFLTSLVSLQFVLTLPFGHDQFGYDSEYRHLWSPWYFKCFVITLMLLIWYMYLKLLLRGTHGCNYGSHLVDKMWDLAYDKARQMRFCVICYTMAKTKRTKHCKLCEVCVTDMDHHCLYLLTCIGRHNHRLFIVFSALVLIAQLSFLFYAFQYFHDYIFSSVLKDITLENLIMDNYLLVLAFPVNLASAFWGFNFVKRQLMNVSRNETQYFQNYKGRDPMMRLDDRLRNLVKFFSGAMYMDSTETEVL